MKKAICEKCGTKNRTEAEFCSKCGNKMPDRIKSNDDMSNNKDKNNTIKNIIFIILIIVVGITSSLVARSITHTNDLKMATSLGTTLENGQNELEELNNKKAEVKKEIKSSNDDLMKIKNEIKAENKKLPTYNKIKGGELLAGTYTVGSDLKEGIYDLKYSPSVGKDKYWSNDYIYVTHSGSEGVQSTLGGSKFDERIGGFNYEVASKGGSGHFTLKKGDKVEVQSEFGNWTY